MKKVRVLIRREEGTEDIPLPSYMSGGASGMDLCAAIDGEVLLSPGETRLIPTGIYISLPAGFEAQIRPRSGLALKHGITVANSPGTIDADYRGQVGIILQNLGSEPFRMKRGDRIAQMVINRVYRAEIELVEELDETDRSSGGFGHTDI